MKIRNKKKQVRKERKDYFLKEEETCKLDLFTSLFFGKSNGRIEVMKYFITLFLIQN